MDDLYSLTRVEPLATSQGEVPWNLEEARAFGRALPDDAGLLGALDEPRAGATIKEEVLLQGWARTPDEDLRVAVFLDGNPLNSMNVERFARPDVCRVVPRLQDCSRAGFRVLVPRKKLATGPHSITLVFHSTNGRSRSLPAREITVAASTSMP